MLEKVSLSIAGYMIDQFGEFFRRRGTQSSGGKVLQRAESGAEIVNAVINASAVIITGVYREYIPGCLKKVVKRASKEMSNQARERKKGDMKASS